jgi:glycosyltransferase involved in cell wall biosynthesis
MRVLLLHNRYRFEGGEERAVAEIAALLRARGDEVSVLERSSAGLARGRAAGALVRGGIDPDEVAAAVRRVGADVLHVHNIHPLFGWRALTAARSAGAATVLHLHNFRLFCAISVGYRDGGVCFRCHGRDMWPGVRLRCRGSLGEAAAYGAGLFAQQPRLLDNADRFIAVSSATARRLISLGLPGERTVALPNFVASRRLADASVADRGQFALVAGRLVEEKGFDVAVTACQAAGVPLVIAGEGPDAPRLRALAAGDDGVRFVGRLPEERLAELRRQAAVVLVPSRWEEPCPYAVLDALADGVPVLASSLGGLPELVSDPLPPGDADAWTDAVRALWADPTERLRRGEVALARARDQFSEQRYYEALTDVYRACG